MKQVLMLLLAVLTFTAHAQRAKVMSASTALNSNDIKEAKTLIDEAFENEATLGLPKAFLTKGDIYTQIYVAQLETLLSAPNSLTTALEAYRKAYKLDMAQEKKPGRYKSDISAGMFNVSRGIFEQAIAKFNAGEYDAATAGFLTCVEIIDFLNENSLLKSSDEEDAAAIKKDALNNGALCALNAEDYDKAADIYKNLISMDAADEKVYANLASIYISKSQFDEAIAIIETGRGLYPENESLAESELNYYIGTNQSEKAIDKLIDAIASKPNNPDLYFNLALAYDKMGNKDKMVETYQKIIEIEPTYQAAYLNLGAYYNEGANEVIKEMNELDWQAAVKLEPKRDEWYNKALPYLEKAYELNSESEAVKRALERIYANLNMLEKAKELRDK